jgi:hypothetical protein
MLFIIMLSGILLSVSMIIVNTKNVIMQCHYAKFHYAEFHYAEFHYAKLHYAEFYYAECHYD